MDCKDLASIADRFETSISKSFIKNGDKKCTEFTVPLSSADVTKIFEDYKCKSLGAIESEIALLEAKEAAFHGFNKLRLDLQIQKEKTADPDPKVAKKAAAEFADGLNKAQTFEAVGIIPDVKRKKFLDDLRKLSDEKIKDSVKLKVEVARICKKLQIPEKIENKSTACDSKSFKPGEASSKELIHFAQLNKHPEAKAEVKGLEIQKKDGTPYSFAQMNLDLIKELEKHKDKKDIPLILEGLKKLNRVELGAVTKDEIKAITSLSDIEAPSEEVKNIIADDRFKNQMSGAMSKKRYWFLIDDLRTRQNLEMRTSMTHLLNEYPAMFGKAKEVCQDLKFGVPNLEDCLNQLQTNMPEVTAGADASDFADKLKGVQNTFQFQKEIAKLSDSPDCAEKDLEDKKTDKLISDKAQSTITKFMRVKGAQLPLRSGTKCDQQILDIFDLDRSYQALEALHSIRTQIMEENVNNFKIRNYTLDTMKEKNCFITPEVSKIEFCDVDTKINPEVTALSSFASDILYRYAKADDQKTDISELCKTDTQKDLQALCADANPGPKAPEEDTVKRDPDYKPLPINPDISPPNTVFSDTVGTLLNVARYALTPSYSAPIPASNYANPNASGPSRMTISQELIAPAVIYGGLGVNTPPYSQLTPSSYASTMFGR